MLWESAVRLQLPTNTRKSVWTLGGLNLLCSLWYYKSNVFLRRRHKVPKSSCGWVMWFSSQVRIFRFLNFRVYPFDARALNEWFPNVHFSITSNPDVPKLTDWTKADLENIFTTNASRPGWCNVDPAEAYAQKVQFKEDCDCKYDGLWGRFCEVPVQSTCINQCSGHGHCRGGFCEVSLLIFSLSVPKDPTSISRLMVI